MFQWFQYTHTLGYTLNHQTRSFYKEMFAYKKINSIIFYSRLFSVFQLDEKDIIMSNQLKFKYNMGKEWDIRFTFWIYIFTLLYNKKEKISLFLLNLIT